jgi:hypothetical protein
MLGWQPWLMCGDECAVPHAFVLHPSIYIPRAVPHDIINPLSACMPRLLLSMAHPMSFL